MKYRIVCLKTGTCIFYVHFLLKCIAGTESKPKVILSDKLVNYGCFVPWESEPVLKDIMLIFTELKNVTDRLCKI